MLRITKFITKTLSFKLSLKLLTALATLLMVALVIMFYFSRNAVKDEASLKATATLDATLQRIDNILLSVEQSSGNIYWKILNHIDQPDKIDTYCQKLVEGNPYIVGCVIAFEPNFFKDRSTFYSYFHQTGKKDADGKMIVVKSDTILSRPYYEQSWYTNAINKGTPDWMEPQREANEGGKPITVFNMPFYVGERKAGVMAVGVPLDLLSKIVQEAKPSPNSFCALLGEDGSYIIHPDSSKLDYKTVFSLKNNDLEPTAKEVAKAMLAGKTGNKKFHLYGTDFYVFYKPFERTVVPGRSMEALNWSIGIIYPEDDIYGDYRRLHYTVFIVAFVGLLLLLLLCYTFIHRRLLPLRMLSLSAQHIAEGHYDERIPDTRQQDEVGHLQKHFQEMQQVLNHHMGEMEQLTHTLEERGKELKAVYELAQAGDHMKTNFLYNMSNQMKEPIDEICLNVKGIKDQIGSMTDETNDELVGNILYQGEKITTALRQLLNDSEKKKQ